CRPAAGHDGVRSPRHHRTGRTGSARCLFRYRGLDSHRPRRAHRRARKQARRSGRVRQAGEQAVKQLAVPYWHVDAFADRPFAGNQAAVMPLETWLPDEVLQAIGEENQFADTAFVVRDDTGAADWELRWFTPACEIR